VIGVLPEPARVSALSKAEPTPSWTHKSKFDETTESVDKVVCRKRMCWDQSRQVIRSLEAVADIGDYEMDSRVLLLSAVPIECFEELFVELPRFPWSVDLARNQMGWPMMAGINEGGVIVVDGVDGVDVVVSSDLSERTTRDVEIHL
jgi:hypothetical protein